MRRRDFLTSATLSTLCAGAPLRVLAQEAPNMSDMDILRAALTLHPGLYRYNSPRQVEAALAQLARRWIQDTWLDARYLMLQRFLAGIRCGHSQVNPFNQSDEIVRALFDRRTRVPFRFEWIDRRMIVTEDMSVAALPPGSEVMMLNGARPSALLAELLPYARADGHNDGKRVAQLAMRNTDEFEIFDILQGIVMPPADGLHHLVAQTPDGKQRRLSLPAQTLAERRASQRIPDSDANQPFWTWEVRDDVAILTMPTWTMYNTKWDWQAWLDERLATLSGLRGMVMDLRDNEGGNECGNVVLSRLTDKDVKFEGYQKRVRYRTTPPALDRYLDTWDKSFRTIGKDARDIGNGFFVLPGEDEETDFIPAKGPRITVPVAALVGPLCSSATFSFARRAQESGLIRLFGEQTGGNLRGINGGAYFFVRLPDSGLSFDLPIIGYYPKRAMPDRGVIPDVEVPRTVADIARGTDSAVLRAIDWIRRGA